MLVLAHTFISYVYTLYCQAHGINFIISVGVFYYRIECLYCISYSELSEIRKHFIDIAPQVFFRMYH